jgi:LuxR family transcriptional regulator
MARVLDRAAQNYVAELYSAASFSDGLDRLANITWDLGYTQVLYAYQHVAPRLPDGQWLPLKLNVRNFPNGWEDGWQRFMEHDPYYHACFKGTLPFDWADVQNPETLDFLEQDAWHYLADMGLSRGMTIPVHLPGGRFAVVSAILDDSRSDWCRLVKNTREVMFHLTHQFNGMIHEKGFEEQVGAPPPIRLSPRELECLRWAAGGKTAWEISKILNRSVETVRLHLKNAKQKLGAANMAHAIAKAAQFGMLQPN